MGFLVFVPGLAQPGQHTTFHLIDGQQRLARCSILLAAIRNVARQANESDLADEIHSDYLVHPRKPADQHFRLLPKERDHDSYIAMISGQGKATGRIADALAHFEERLAPIAAETPARLRQIFHTMSQRLEFMCATLEAENTYNIFKSLNSTGVPLGPADLIRNFVFMHILPDDHDQFDHDLWGPLEERFTKADGTLDEERFSKFFRDFLMSTGRYVAPKDTFTDFEGRYEAKSKRLINQVRSWKRIYQRGGGRRRQAKLLHELPRDPCPPVLVLKQRRCRDQFMTDAGVSCARDGFSECDRQAHGPRGTGCTKLRQQEVANPIVGKLARPGDLPINRTSISLTVCCDRLETRRHSPTVRDTRLLGVRDKQIAAVVLLLPVLGSANTMSISHSSEALLNTRAAQHRVERAAPGNLRAN